MQLTQPCLEKKSSITVIKEEIPIYFFSKKLCATQPNRSIIEKEAHAIVYALQRLHYYLDGTEFVMKLIWSC